MSGSRLNGLDALRGIAALLVVGLHARAVFGGEHWFGKGFLAVDFFLMLSGFLMTRATEPRIGQTLSATRFMIQRYRRMWGMVALGSLIGAPYMWLRSQGLADFLPAFLANLALIPWPHLGLLFAANIPAWTIFFELVANGSHVFALRRLGTLALAFCWILMLGLTIWVAASFGSLDVGAKVVNAHAAIPRVFLAYLTGLLIARIWREKPPLPMPSWIALVIMPVAVLGSHALEWRHWSFDLVFILVICPLTIFGGWRAKGFGWFGRWSAAYAFPLFAIHLPILEGMRELGLTLWPSVAVALVVAGIVTWWTTRPRSVS